ncbi:PKD domain-containing protein [Candidatus Halobeggiatoa sp. HSG11]|nr:PKD domain-containing protein [Candidatus Halobeggiatoa sp. HSG11]
MKKLAIILLLLSSSTYAMQLFDGKSFIYDIGSNGVLQHGTLNAYDNMYHLRINGANYVGDIAGISPNGRKVRLEVFTEPGSGLEIKRNIYVSKTKNFARYTEILTNPTNTDVSVEVEVYGNLGASTEAAAQTNFLITEADNKPTLLHYHSQVNNPFTATYTLNNNLLSWKYPIVKVPAKQSVRLIYFVAQTKDVATAHQVATQIYGNPTFIYDTISTSVQEKILNFQPSQALPHDESGEDFSAAPFLNVDELRTGILDKTDNWSLQRVATPADAYALNLETDETVTIRMSASFNSYLHLFADVSGQELLATNDDKELNTTNAEIVFTAEVAGTYYIEATTYDRTELGNYSLEILANSINRPPRIYPFKLVAEQFIIPATIIFTDLSQDLDGEITERCWQFGDGTQVTCTTENTITHTFSQVGHYSVGLTVSDDKGAYAYHNEPISIGAVPEGIVLRESNTVSGDLATSDQYSQTRSGALADRYRITSVIAGQELLINMTSDDFDSYLYLYDQFNRLLNQGDKTLRYTPMHDGDLLLEATSLEDMSAGKYDLTLEFAKETIDLPVSIDIVTQPELQRLFIARLPESFKATFIRWDFGDNSKEVGTDKSIVSYTYSSLGKFIVSLTAFNAEGQQLTGQQAFNVQNETVLPQARFRVSPMFGEKPLQVFFSNESFSTADDLKYKWDFGDGKVSTSINPSHKFTQGGTYHVTLQAYSKSVNASYTVPITVIDRANVTIPVTGIVRELPQVLMAGFDPMLIDLLDTNVKIFAIVRPGRTPLQTVSFGGGSGSITENFGLVMQHVATYANGDQRYETVFTFEQGSYPVVTIDNIFENFKIRATDQAGQFHIYPNLEIGSYPLEQVAPKSLNIEPLHQAGVRRRQPQVLAVGFDPALVHKSNPTLIDGSDSQFMFKAIVREGLFAIQTVILQQDELSWPMSLLETLPNGDKLYAVNYTYPSNSLAKGTLDNLIGVKPEQFSVVVTDKDSQTHRFPELKVGNFPQR